LGCIGCFYERKCSYGYKVDMCYIPLVASRNDATGSDMLGVN
jgi:hypothetical protein